MSAPSPNQPLGERFFHVFPVLGLWRGGCSQEAAECGVIPRRCQKAPSWDLGDIKLGLWGFMFGGA